MDNIRFKALAFAISRPGRSVKFPDQKASEYFGELTFNRAAMREYLTEEAYNQVMNSIEKGKKIDRKIADQVAAGIKAWAISKGATHYTHWFLPLTGATAEKHDAFVDPVEGGQGIEKFRGSELTQQEPDASSFPSGGIRSTFEARGYTAWDPTSPAFIMDRTLCIPTVFVSYTGEALDYKTPLLKAIWSIDKAAVDVCRYFDNNITKVFPTLGWEQEYFLVDNALYLARPDLVLTGRTLFGHSSAKDQQLEDHYFGTIPQRVLAFMQEFELEAHRLGIPVKTRHNEVAPNQFECAPVYEEVNLSIDHNQLMMHLLDKVAKRHDFTVLLHEKPFSGINGSGKHNNWSLATNTRENLLSPGKTFKANLRFLTFLVNIIKAVNDHAELIRAIIASPGNDHRLGGNEAPPAIISVFIGSQLTLMLDVISKADKHISINANIDNGLLKNLPKIPEILLDNTDRNRTSPFAFTGNKFEFRAVGSAQTCAPPMIVLNLIVADQLRQFKKEVDALILKKVTKEDALFQVIKRYIRESRKILFEGNNYSQEWEEEALKRGLSNIKATPEALKAFITKKSVDLFERNNVLTKRELIARHEIRLENYTKKIQIESRVLGDLAGNHIIPVAIRYQNTLIENVKGLKQVLDLKTYGKLSQNQMDSITEISEHIDKIKTFLNEMIEARKGANRIQEAEEKAFAYSDTVLPYFEKIRYHADKLELLIDDELWPLPKYRELLFTR
ncbi:MAG: glutamine synthetase III [Bacteroidales bacterium]|jgi:glutamine synthetase|nr:glutamine synthetase III [Bacteroidales bacterium]